MNLPTQLADNWAEEDAPLILRKPMRDEAKFDITAMIDLVFMMNIFFLVTTITAALGEMDLPTARRCVVADRDNSVLITILRDGDQGPVIVYIGDAEEGAPLSDPEEQNRAVRAAVEAGVREKRHTVLVKAARNVRLRDVTRISSAGTAVPETDLKMAVIEKE
jgi:biopolymer transport protein ExbD